MKKYFFSPKYLAINRQSILYLDLLDDVGSVWGSKSFFETLDAVLQKRFKNIQGISSIAYYEQNRKTFNPHEFNQFLEERQLRLGSLEADQPQEKYIFILQLLLVSLATKHISLITDPAIAGAIFDRTKALYQNLYNGMGARIRLNKRLFSGPSLQFELPLHLSVEDLFPHNEVMAAPCKEEEKQSSVLDPLVETDELTGMSEELSEIEEGLPECEGEASISCSMPAPGEIAQGTPNTGFPFFPCLEIKTPNHVSQSTKTGTENISQDVETLLKIRCLLHSKLMISNPNYKNSKDLENSLPKDSILKVAFHIISEGFKPNKEKKFQENKIKSAIRQLQLTFKAELMEEDCEQIKEVYTLLNISVSPPSTPGLTK